MAEEDDPGAKIEGLLKTLAETARCDHVIRSKSTTSGNVLPPLLDYDTELRFLEAEDLLHGMRESSREIERDIAQLKSGNLPVDMHDDAPLKLECDMSSRISGSVYGRQGIPALVGILHGEDPASCD